jgi:SAM-dependent MidA family methyltransferase
MKDKGERMNFQTSDFTLHPLEDDSNLVLCEALASRIAESPQHRITFAQYMDMVLYHPAHGYYATKTEKIGVQGDFFTSPLLGADFGELLAKQFVQMWEILGKPAPFSLVEMGAGQGILAGDILTYLKQHQPDFFAVLDYTIIEKSSALRQEQQQRLQEFSLRWCNLEEISTNSITGCFFSNELVDALPVHQFTLQQGRLREIYVTTKNLTPQPPSLSGKGEIEFIEVIEEISTPELAKYFDLVDIKLLSNAYPDGYRSEVNLAALEELKMVGDRLQRGYVLTIDYGYPASRYYSPTRSQGTLQCYYQHRHHDNPYINIGRQDITAHVDFTALERWGDSCGLHKVGFTQQGLFLMALGIGDRIATVSQSSDRSIQEILRRREALHQLINPQGLGGFGVLVQGKGLTEEEVAQNLQGLSFPPV